MIAVGTSSGVVSTRCKHKVGVGVAREAQEEEEEKEKTLLPGALLGREAEKAKGLPKELEAKKVEEVKVRPKECFKCRRRCTGRRTLASSPTSEPKPTPSRSGRSRGAPTRCWTRRDAKRGGRRSSASGGRATRRS